MAPATSLDEVVRRSVAEVVARASGAIASQVARVAAAELERQLSATVNGRGPKRATVPARGRPRRKRGEEITKWVADHRARRVPNFVIEMTGGLDTKKKIVAKYGKNVVFEKGKALPK